MGASIGMRQQLARILRQFAGGVVIAIPSAREARADLSYGFRRVRLIPLVGVAGWRRLCIDSLCFGYHCPGCGDVESDRRASRLNNES